MNKKQTATLRYPSKQVFAAYNRILSQHATDYWVLDSGIQKRVMEMDEKGLRVLLEACDTMTKTNCWYATYEAAQMMRAAAQRVLKSRSKPSKETQP